MKNFDRHLMKMENMSKSRPTSDIRQWCLQCCNDAMTLSAAPWGAPLSGPISGHCCHPGTWDQYWPLRTVSFRHLSVESWAEVWGDDARAWGRCGPGHHTQTPHHHASMSAEARNYHFTTQYRINQKMKPLDVRIWTNGIITQCFRQKTHPPQSIVTFH